MKSPLIKNGDSDIVDTYRSVDIIQSYKTQLQIDVSRFFGNVATVNLYECRKTKLKFFDAVNSAGDGAFYADLQKKRWYYSDDKSEYKVTLDLVAKCLDPDLECTLLEIGCGDGQFLKLAKDAGAQAHGIEINTDAVNAARAKGLSCEVCDFMDFAKLNPGNFDIVCAFQVLEHITNPLDFIESAVHCLKPGGHLVFSVPDNGGWVKANRLGALNLPPHHLLRWDEYSLKEIAEIFALHVVSIETEALAITHTQNFVGALRLEAQKGKGLLTKALLKCIEPDLLRAAKALRNSLKGHTVTAIYHKRAK